MMFDFQKVWCLVMFGVDPGGTLLSIVVVFLSRFIYLCVIILYNFRVKILMLLRLPLGLVAGGPPCSLFVWLCTSVHRRREIFPRGDERNPKVLCANVITENFAICMR